MHVPESFVNEHRREIEIEADRLHVLRSIFNQLNDTPHDNWITACSHIWVRYEKNAPKFT